MIYEISATTQTDLIKNEELVNSIISKRPELSNKEAREQIIKSWHIAAAFMPVKKIKVEGEVCPDCGSSDLIRTGVCKACLICGASLGCS